MAELRFRVYFGGQPATVEDLAQIEEITVDQAEDVAWEARLVLGLCLDDQGRWSRQEDLRLRPRTQVRIELRIGSEPWAPLIDGPIVSIDTAMDARPGRSTATVVVHDDSAWLNRRSGPIRIEGRSDEEIARELFLTGSDGHVVTTDIRIPAASAPPALGAQFAQLGTPMQMLRHLAERNGCHAYVLPGSQPGRSIGCFKADPVAPGTLPPFVLLGGGRNLMDVSVSEDPESSERTVIHSLRLSDQQIVSYTSQESDETLLGAEAAANEPPERNAGPSSNDTEDPAARARARALRQNHPLKYSGRVQACAYPKVLRPYEKVTLQAGGARQSSVLLLTQVTHRITPSQYAVEFEGRGNAFSALGAAVPGLPAGVF